MMSTFVGLILLALNSHQLSGAPANDDGVSLNQRQRRAVSVGADLQAALETHNRLRRLEALTTDPGVANMEAMVWNSDVAVLANNWASQCQWSHDPTISSMSTPVGQNLYAIAGAPLNITKAIEAWYNEKVYYNYDTTQCQSGQVCGHYTQVVWATSNQIGCATVNCPVINCSSAFGCPTWTGPMYNAYLYACDYKPSGNYANTKPYTRGPVCTQCPSGKMWCSNGLCNSSCTTPGPNCTCQLSSCSNHGTLNSSSCTCSCNPGWSGSDCSVCQLNSCNNHGTLNFSSCACSCNPGRSGIDCSACQPNSCSSHGTPNANTCTCSCDSGWGGTNCGDKTASSTPITRASYSTTAILIFVIGFTMFVIRDDFF